MRPLIGITCSLASTGPLSSYIVPKDYINAISHTGGEGVIIPYTDSQGIFELVQSLDGIVLSGGDDIDPFHYSEEPSLALGKIDPYRDLFELELVKTAMRFPIPILGICRGMQVLYVAMGGQLIQDISSEVKDSIKHQQESLRTHPSHTITVEKGSKLSGMIGAGQVRVNSFHHQAVKELQDDNPLTFIYGSADKELLDGKFIVSARAIDNVIEAIEFAGDRFVLGVQWHPETMFDTSPAMIEIFAAFVAEAGARR